MKVSVIIPVYRDWARLSLCLDALAEQTYPSDLVEILVVNNDPSSAEPEGFEVPENCRVLEESRPGSYAARNRGLDVAQGEVICFTDADCRPSPNWLQEIVALFRRNLDVDIVGGEIRLDASSDSKNPAELYELLYSLKQESYVGQSWAATANMSARRRVFDRIGAFDAKLFSNGDYEWGQRASKAGFVIAFSPVAYVWHPARTSSQLILAKFRRIVGGQVVRKIQTVGYWRCLLLYVFTFPFKFLPPLTDVAELKANQQIGLMQRILVYQLMYRIKIAKNFERGRLLIFRGMPERV